MTRWLIISALYAATFLFSSKIDAMQAIVGGLLCGGVSILVLKLFRMDNKN